jgi:hypothetical protein
VLVLKIGNYADNQDQCSWWSTQLRQILENMNILSIWRNTEIGPSVKSLSERHKRWHAAPNSMQQPQENVRKCCSWFMIPKCVETLLKRGENYSRIEWYSRSLSATPWVKARDTPRLWWSLDVILTRRPTSDRDAATIHGFWIPDFLVSEFLRANIIVSIVRKKTLQIWK